ncbi:hypothetical protein AMELA_G00294670 [Ameiurus melas]|uniref:Uncharacterized protein n=1 Tax=Ameiurus melas TaxID=219545 RepID=A0A7J5ZIB6_AMEME|nr:hypothetical protein AMELA_G00294670 [Ameiurus melas]
MDEALARKTHQVAQLEWLRQADPCAAASSTWFRHSERTSRRKWLGLSACKGIRSGLSYQSSRPLPRHLLLQITAGHTFTSLQHQCVKSNPASAQSSLTGNSHGIKTQKHGVPLNC